MSRGIHIILDCYDVPSVVCLDDKLLLEIAIKAASAGSATIINTMRYRFGYESPPGCTVVIMLDESHISVHTYAEKQMIAIDIFTCGNTNAEVIANQFKTDLNLKKFEQRTLKRF